MWAAAGVSEEDKLDAEQLYVTSIAARHGQAFEGFLHMTEFTFAAEHPGASELFRAHEVAHEWFGHKIGWPSYRDQWLSESLAEYAAMLFVQSFVKGGEKYFDDEIVARASIAGAPASWKVESPADFIIGFTYQATNGFFVGWGASYGLNTSNRSDVSGAGFTKKKTFDRWGNQVRLGWHPGVRVYVAPPPPPPPAPFAVPAIIKTVADGDFSRFVASGGLFRGRMGKFPQDARLSSLRGGS